MLEQIMNSSFYVVIRWALMLSLGTVLGVPGVTLSMRASDDAVDAEAKVKTPGPSVGVGPDYRLAPRDQVQVVVFNQADVGTTQRLTSNGEVRLPLIGRVVLQGLTVREAEQHVEKLYVDGGFFKDPQIIISVSEYSTRTVTMLGQVQSPKRVELAPEANSIGILEAVTLAGGLTRIAKADAVQVTRTQPDGSTKRVEVNVQELLNARRSDDKREFQLLAGDVVFVPERAF